MTEDSSYFLAYFSDGLMNITRYLSQAEYDEAVSARSIVNDLWPDYQLLSICTLNLQSYNQALERFSTYAKEEEEILSVDHSSFALDMNRHLINFLNSFKMILDHLTYTITHRYGKDSAVLSQYEESTKQQFDNVFAYRFISKLRDYSQHCSMPIHITTITMLTKPSNGNTARKLELFLLRDKLLQDFDGWGAVVKREIPKLPAKIEIDQYLPATLSSLGVIFKEFVTSRWPSIVESCRLVTRLAGENSSRLAIYCPPDRTSYEENEVACEEEEEALAYEEDGIGWDRLQLPVDELSKVLEYLGFDLD